MSKLAVGDTDVSRQYAAYFTHWADFAAETVYFTDYQDTRFITINATRDTAFLTPENLPACTEAACPSTKVARLWTEFQGAWLDQVLETSPSKWNVVTFHQPVFSTSSGRDEPVLREIWVPIFQKHNIDLVLMGHDHTYGRGILNTDKTDTPGLTTGPVYAVSNSGAKHYNLETDAKNVWTNNGATQVLRGAGVTTYQVVDVSSDKLRYRSYLAEKTANATTDLPVGALYDEFTINKSDAGKKWVTEAGVTAPAEPTATPEPAVTAEPSATSEPSATPAAIDPQTLTEANRGGVVAPASATAGQNIDVSLGSEAAGSKVWAWLYSTPTLLGNFTADETGTLTAKVPVDASPGQHRIVIQASDGSLLGWASLQVVAAENIIPSPSGSASNSASTRGSSATPGPQANQGELANTGANTALVSSVALALLLLGATFAAVGIRRRRASQHAASHR